MIWLFPGKTRMDASVFLIGFPVVNLVAYLIYQHVERPLQSWKLPSFNERRTGSDGAPPNHERHPA